jgi:uncharacterized protein involved in type VI secretion and phage assembly
MNTMSAVPDEVTVEAGGHAKGVAVAIVTENKDASGQGRVKVRFPWHDQPTNSHWARIAMPMAGASRGVYFLPEVGDEVLVAFERGDVRFPYIVGSLWNGVDKAPANNGDGKNDLRLIHSRKGHKLTFDDGAKGRVRLELSDGKHIEFDDQGLRLDDGKGNSIAFASNSGSVEIKAATSLTIKAPRITIEASGTMAIKAGATLTLNGTLVSIN